MKTEAEWSGTKKKMKKKTHAYQHFKSAIFDRLTKQEREQEIENKKCYFEMNSIRL